MLLFCLCVSCCPALPGNAAEPNRPPNIVYVLADDLGYAELGCYGQKKIRTPQSRPAARGNPVHPALQRQRGSFPVALRPDDRETRRHAHVRNNRRAKLPAEVLARYGSQFPARNRSRRRSDDRRGAQAERLRHGGDRQMGARPVRHQRRSEPPGF